MLHTHAWEPALLSQALEAWQSISIAAPQSLSDQLLLDRAYAHCATRNGPPQPIVLSRFEFSCRVRSAGPCAPCMLSAVSPTTSSIARIARRGKR